MRIEAKTHPEEDGQQPVCCISGEDERHIVTSAWAPYLFHQDHSQGVEQAKSDRQQRHANSFPTLHESHESYKEERRVDERGHDRHDFEPQRVGAKQRIGQLAPPKDALEHELQLDQRSEDKM